MKLSHHKLYSNFQQWPTLYCKKKSPIIQSSFGLFSERFSTFYSIHETTAKQWGVEKNIPVIMKDIRPVWTANKQQPNQNHWEHVQTGNFTDETSMKQHCIKISCTNSAIINSVLFLNNTLFSPSLKWQTLSQHVTPFIPTTVACHNSS